MPKRQIVDWHLKKSNTKLPRPPTKAKAKAKAKVSTVVAPSIDAAAFILRTLRQSPNPLGLNESELESMAVVLHQSKSEVELAQWSETLMLPHHFVSEVIALRDRKGCEETQQKLKKRPVSSETVAVARTGRDRSVTEVTSVNPTEESESSWSVRCGCAATEHELRFNCLHCGRIYCSREVPESLQSSQKKHRCLSCGQRDLFRKSNTFINQQQQRTKAVEQRDKLLHFVEHKEEQTRIVDDQDADDMAWPQGNSEERNWQPFPLNRQQFELTELGKNQSALVKQNRSFGLPKYLTTQQQQQSDDSISSCSEEWSEEPIPPLTDLLKELF